jgi:NIMA-interacting peptidyl-prolyl cis-trans isomerase 4
MGGGNPKKSKNVAVDPDEDPYATGPKIPTVKAGKGNKAAKADTAGTSGYTKIKCRHILCEKQSQAIEALTKIAEGVPFNQVAADYSQDKARTGGDLGWKLRGELHGTFAEVAFALPVGGMTTEPVKTPFGYHIILVEGKQ